MKRLDYSSRTFSKELARFQAAGAAPARCDDDVRQIIRAIESKGDSAVSRYIHEFDRVRLTPSRFRVGEGEMRAARAAVSAGRKRAMRASIAAVKQFSRHGVPKNWKMRNPDGAIVGETFHPIRRVGIYVPGGKAPLVSTVIMTVTLAKMARVPEVAVFTPSNARGEVSQEVLAVLDLLGIREVYRVGGVQAVAAMAFGTKTIPAVDKIFGPGNAFVVEAKRQLFGRVGIDLLPGPSEVMVIAGNRANPAWVAADLLSQAEHGPGGKIFLAAFSEKMLERVESEMSRQSDTLARAKEVRSVLKSGYAGIRVKRLSEAIEVANRIAPEHLELHLDQDQCRACMKEIRTAGSLLIGPYTPTVTGDFAAGPSHVLPTGGSGRYSSGLRVTDFLRKSSFVQYDVKSLERASETVAAFSEMEDLPAHGRSAEIRFTEK